MEDTKILTATGVPEQVVPSAPDSTPKKLGRPRIGAAPMTGAQRQAKHYKNKREKDQAANVKHDSKREPTKPEAKHLLELRGLDNPHVIDRVHGLLVRAAEELGLPQNRFLFSHGIIQTLKSCEAKEGLPLPEIAAEQVTGELLNRAELYALYDASIAWREELSFEEFLSIRHTCKTDCFLLGRDVLEKDFAECHRVWTEFFPRFNPDTLPPNYTQKQAIKWLNEQSELKNFLLLASRSSFKSSWSHIWLLSLILCFPDVRVLLVSETRPLAKDFIGVIRSYFETTPGHESRFNQLFPEFSIAMGDGSVLSLDCPMARLRLPQSIESTSMDSAVAGRRFDVGLFDDPISNTSCGNDVQIQASYNKFLALLKLRETSGVVLVLGTPWAENDLYSRLIALADSGEASWVYRVDPAFVVKREARHKLTPGLLPTLVESDIESYLFPERLNWRFLKQEISNSPSFFMSQNLVIFPRDSDSDLKVSFSEEDIRAHIRPAAFFESPVSTTVMSLDRAFSTARYADFSCLTIGKILQKDHKTICAIADVKMERWKESELVDNIVRMIDRHRPTGFVLEKDKGWENLIETVRKNLMMRGIPVPRIMAKDIAAGGHNAQAKAKRIKKLELPLSDGRLWFFSSALWNDIVMAQFVKFDGIHDSNSHRKDDACDSVSLLYETFMPKVMSETDDPVDSVEQARIDREVEDEIRKEMNGRHYASMFGSPQGQDYQVQPKESEQQPERKTDPRLAQLAKRLPPGMRI